MGSKSSKMAASLVDGLTSTIEFLEGAIEDFMEAREDPNIGTAFDEIICDMADFAKDLEGILGGKSEKRRNLKAKSGKTGILFCLESGKSAKTTSPSPSATATATSKAKSAKSGKTFSPSPSTTSPKSVKSAKSIKSAESVKTTKSEKSAKVISHPFSWSSASKSDKASKAPRCKEKDPGNLPISL